MNSFLTTILTIATLCSCCLGLVFGGEDEEVNHSKFTAVQLARPSLGGDQPMVLREDWWKGSVEVGKAKLVQLHLFRGNTYQFWLALEQEGIPVNLNVYDRDGGLIKVEQLKFEQGKHLKSVKFTAPATGIYFLRIALASDAKRSSEWALVYAYQS